MPTRLRTDNFDWNAENIAEAIRLFSVEGKSPGEISKLWKKKKNAPSRNAVMGKLKRLGLIGDPAKPARKSKPRQHRHKDKNDGISAKINRKPGGHHTFSFKRLHAVTAPPPVPNVTHNAAKKEARALKPVTLEHGRPAKVEDLNATICRFIIGDPRDPSFAYCGRGSHGSSPYCASHRLLVYDRVAA